MKKFFALLFLVSIPSISHSFQPSGMTTFNASLPGCSLVSIHYYNEGAGTVGYDATGNAHGDFTSGPSWVSGKHGQAVGFAGGADRVTLRNESTFDYIDVTSSFTIVLYRKFQDNITVGGWLVTKANSTAVAGWWIRKTSTANGDLSFEWTTVGNQRKNYIPTQTDRFYVTGGYKLLIFNYACQSSGSQAAWWRIFVDGKSYPVTSDYVEPLTTSFTNNDKVNINGFDGGGTNGDKGTIDFDAFYNCAGSKNLSDGAARAYTDFVVGSSRGF